MNTKQNALRMLAATLLVALVAFVFSCKKDADPISGEVAQTVSNESTQDAQQDEVDDMVSTQFNKSDNAGKVATDDDERVACAKITFTPSTEEKLSGTLTIDFDHKPNGDPNPDGCTDARGNVRKGLITVTWEGGRWYHVGSVITVTLTDYSINGVVINGTRVLSNITDNVLKPTWTIYANHTTVWPTGETSNRTVNKTRQWDIVAGTITVTQTAGAEFAATGTTRNGRNYTVTITSGLVYKLACIRTSKVYIPVSGTKIIEFDSKTVTVDYGSGECDNTFTISFDGHTRTVTARNDGGND